MFLSKKEEEKEGSGGGGAERYTNLRYLQRRHLTVDKTDAVSALIAHLVQQEREFEDIISKNENNT